MLEGKKTFVGIIVILLGVLGIGELFSEAEVAQTIDLIFQVVGLVATFYGRLKARKIYGGK